MRFLILVVLAAVMAAGTLYVGWWAVPVIAALWGLLAGWRAHGTGRAGLAAAAAALGWAALLALDALGGRLVGLAELFARTARLPAAVFPVLTLVFPALLAWAAAALAGSVWPDRTRKRRIYVPGSEAIADRVVGPRRKDRAPAGR
jgi:hypothetical protein